MRYFFTTRLNLYLFLTLMIFPWFCSFYVYAGDSWERVISSVDGDTWYVDRILAYEKQGDIQSVKAYVKCTPGENSSVAVMIRKNLHRQGVNGKAIYYFVESVEVDCIKNRALVFDVAFFDTDDAVISNEVFSKPREYKISDPDGIYEVLGNELCHQSFLHVLDILKKKKPFLYLFSQRETP